jgi:hypothetical protein
MVGVDAVAERPRRDSSELLDSTIPNGPRVDVIEETFQRSQ